MNILCYVAMVLLSVSDPADNSTASELARLWLWITAPRGKR